MFNSNTGVEDFITKPSWVEMTEQIQIVGFYGPDLEVGFATTS